MNTINYSIAPATSTLLSRKTKFSLSLLLVILLALQSFAANTPVIRKSISPAAFSNLKVYDDVNVILLEGDTSEIVIEGQESAVDAVQIEQTGDDLIIHKNAGSDEPVFLYITVKDLALIEAHNSARVGCSDTLHSKSLSLLITGSGEIDVKASSEKVIGVSSSKGRIIVQGDYNQSVSRIDSHGRMITAFLKNNSSPSM